MTVTVNSDDPPMFGTTLNREYAIAADLLDLDEAGLAELARTAVRASFAPDDVKARILGEIDAYAAGARKGIRPRNLIHGGASTFVTARAPGSGDCSGVSAETCARDLQ